MSWRVLQSDYNVERQSCFGELDKIAQSRNSGGSFSEYQIYDLLRGQMIDAFTYMKNPGSSEYNEYLLKQQPVYEKLRKKIFGLSG